MSNQTKTTNRSIFSPVEYPTKTALVTYKPEIIYPNVDNRKLQRIAFKRRVTKRAKLAGGLIILLIPRLTLFAAAIGGAALAAWLVFVYILEPVLDFIGRNWLVIVLGIGLLIVLFFLALLYPEFRAIQRAKSMPVDFYPPSNTETHVNTSRKEGIVIQNIINIQTNNK